MYHYILSSTSFTFISSKSSSFFSYFSYFFSYFSSFFSFFSPYGAGFQFSFSNDMEFKVQKVELICLISSSFNSRNQRVQASFFYELRAEIFLHRSSSCLPSIPLYYFFLIFFIKASSFSGNSVAFLLISSIYFISFSTNSSTSFLNFTKHSSYLFRPFSNSSEGFLSFKILFISSLKLMELSLSPWKCLASHYSESQVVQKKGQMEHSGWRQTK